MKLKKIKLDVLFEKDLMSLFNWINNRKERIYNSPYFPVSEIEHKKWFDEISNKKDVVIFSIRKIKNNELVGTCQLKKISYFHKKAELQIRIGEEKHRNKGYGKEAILLLLKFAFFDLNLQKIYLYVFSTNERAINLYEKLGFVNEGLLKKDAYIDGKFIDTHIMSIFKEDYLNYSKNQHKK